MQLTSILNKIVGKPSEISPNRKLILLINFATSVFSLFAFIVNACLGLSPWLVVSTFLGFIFFACFFFATRKGVLTYLTYWLSSIFSLIYLDVLWYFNFGSKGPILLIFVIFYTILLILWSGWQRYIMLGMLFINLFLLFLTEYYYPELLHNYPDAKTRLIDVYSSFPIYIGLTSIILLYARNVYIEEKERAQRADKLKSAFLANMSHEIRTPMNAIMGFASLLRKKDLPEDKRLRYLDILNNSSNFLLQLLNDIVDVSKIEADQLEISISKFSLFPFFEEIKMTFFQLLERYNKTHITFNIQHPPENIWIHTDKSRLNQILFNLLMNAIKFTETGTIELKCQINDSFLLFSVSDTGIGIDKSNQDSIFSRFIKIDNPSASKLYRGAGLGLSISKHLVEKLGGDIWVKSEKDKGSEFFFTLPYTSEPEAEKAKPIENVQAPVSQKTVLIVEDEAENFELLVEFLEPAGLHLHWASNAAEAIAISASVTFDLMLIDIKLPDMDGNDLLKKLRQLNVTAPAIAQTAYAMQGDEQSLRSEGFDDYISKPIDQSLFLSKVFKFL